MKLPTRKELWLSCHAANLVWSKAPGRPLSIASTHVPARIELASSILLYNGTPSLELRDVSEHL